MPLPDEEFALELAELRRSYQALILDMLALLVPVRDRAASGALSSDDRDLIVHKSHQFAGTGASYGFPRLSQAGRTLNDFLVDHPEAAVSRVLPLFEAFLRAARSAAGSIAAGAG